MIEKYGLFDSLEGDEREYAEADLARMCRAMAGNGVRGGADALRVSAAEVGLTVNVAPGLAMIEGRYYELADDGSGAFSLNLQAATENPRIDRIVLTLDFAARTVTLGVLRGSEAAAPQAPELTRSTAAYMLSLAQVRVAVGAGALDDACVTDERADEAVCGLYVVTAQAAMEAAGSAMEAAQQGIADAAQAMEEANRRALTVNGTAPDSAGNIELDITPASIGAAVIRFFTADFPVSGWAAQSDGSYTQQVSVTGLSANMHGHVDVDMSAVTASTASDVIEAWTMIGRAEGIDGALKLTSFDGKPAAGLTVKLEVIV